MGYLIYRVARREAAFRSLRPVARLPLLLLLTVAVSILPDLDAIPGLLSGDFARFHNQATHSLFTGLLVALPLAAWISWRRTRALSPREPASPHLPAGWISWPRASHFWRWFVVILASYDLHVLLDFFTQGRGVMLFWPFSVERFQSPVLLFMGVRWSEGLFSHLHLLTLASELIFVILAFALITLAERRVCVLCPEPEPGD